MKFATRLIQFDLPKDAIIIDGHIQSINANHFIVVLTNNGHVIRLDWDGENQENLADISSHIDLEEATEIYCYENYIAIVNNRNTKGIVLNSSRQNWSFPLLRGDFCVEVSSYPISFFTRNNQVHIIYGTDWNRLDITNLETKKLLTTRTITTDPAKNGFDYFHGKLYNSPDEENFVSTGWHWHPIDWLFSLNIDEFLKTFELGEISIDRPDDINALECVFDRPLSLIDNEVMAWGYNPTVFGDKIEQRQKSQLIIQNIKSGKILDKLPFDYFSLEAVGNEVSGKLFYDLKNQYFITFSDTHDLVITNKKGVEIARKDFRPDRYSPMARAALKIHKAKINILYWLEE